MSILSYVKDEIQVIRERDPAIKSNMEVFLYPSFKVILNYRIAHKLYLKSISSGQDGSPRGLHERPGLKSIREQQ